jgi:hypothetical protein
MRFIKWAVAAVAASSLLGCEGSQPSLYRVAVDPVAQSVPATCYRTGQAPANPDKTTNIVDQQQWVVWEGVDDTAYLEAGAINYILGQAQRVTINSNGGAIQGTKVDGKYTFVSERTQTDSPTEVYTTSATYTIDKLGETLEGTLALHSHCTGADCGGIPTCDVSVGFVGRKIDADQIRLYNPGAGN